MEHREVLSERLSTDHEFRERLINNPRETINEIFGVTLPSHLTVKVVEDTDEKIHIIVPPKTKLDDAELDEIAGGVVQWLYTGPLDLR